MTGIKIYIEVPKILLKELHEEGRSLEDLLEDISEDFGQSPLNIEGEAGASRSLITWTVVQAALLGAAGYTFGKLGEKLFDKFADPIMDKLFDPVLKKLNLVKSKDDKIVIEIRPVQTNETEGIDEAKLVQTGTILNLDGDTKALYIKIQLEK